MSDQSQSAMLALAQFARPVTVSFIEKAQDWPTRQKIQYEAMLGLLKDDFLGLKDFKEQMNLYSNANPVYLKGPLAAITALMPLNRNLLTRLAPDPVLGALVGRFLETIAGFSLANLEPQEILQGSLGSTLGIG